MKMTPDYSRTQVPGQPSSGKNQQKRTPLEIAKDHANRGWTSVLVPLRSKKPAFGGWGDHSFETDDVEKLFNNEPANVGVLLGPKSGGLTDVDLDCPEAVKVAPRFLPDTDAVFGRSSNPSSHYLYETSLAAKYDLATIAFKDPTDGKVLLEVRIGGGGKAAQTIFPGSVHESGEPIEWVSAGDAEPVTDDELMNSCSTVAAVSLMAKNWGEPGSRNDHRMILHGLLLRHNFTIEESAMLVGAVTLAAGGDEDPDQRLSEARSTQEKLANGGNVFGYPAFEEAFGKKVAGRVTEWLGISVKMAAPASEIKIDAGISARSLQKQTFPEIKFIVEDYITEGLTLLAAKPKFGKSWMALDISVAVASGGMALGSIECQQGDVLYLALEDNNRRLQRRMRKMLPSQQWPERLELRTSSKRLDAGGLEEITQWLDRHPEARLVIIDTLAKVRGSEKDTSSAYAADYKALEEIQRLAIDSSIAVVIIHHVRKMEADDPIDAVSGTTGLTGAADTILVLKREINGSITLYGRGRDVEEIETVIEFDTNVCVWRIIGDAKTARLSEDKRAVLTTLEEATGSLSPKDVGEATGISDQNIRQLLVRMCKAGEVKKTGHGKYTLCDDLFTEP